MSNNSFWYDVKYTDKKGQSQKDTVLAKDIEMAEEKVKSENEVREIQSLRKSSSLDEFKEAMNNPSKKEEIIKGF